jgi:hypothetical protein
VLTPGSEKTGLGCESSVGRVEQGEEMAGKKNIEWMLPGLNILLHYGGVRFFL